MRREKTIAGTISVLRREYYPFPLSQGDTNQEQNEKLSSNLKKCS
jgi:hypothetical protein